MTLDNSARVSIRAALVLSLIQVRVLGIGGRELNKCQLHFGLVRYITLLDECFYLSRRRRSTASKASLSVTELAPSPCLTTGR